MSHSVPSPPLNESVSKSDKHPIKPYVLLVLGMHRSGTSALTRVINLLGADLPKQLMSPKRGDNEMGFWESPKLMNIHNELLQCLDAGWDSISTWESGWHRSSLGQDYRERLLTFLREDFNHSHFFVLKDPRVCRLLPLWIDVLADFGAEPRVVIPVRNPLEVANSLKARDDFLMAKSLLLWLRYMLDTEAESRQLQRSFVTYDALLRDWRGVTDKIAEDLNLIWPRRSRKRQVRIERFLTNKQRHHVLPDDSLLSCPEVTGWVKQTYQILLQMVHQPEQQELQDQLDEIRFVLDSADMSYGMVLADQEQTFSQRQEMFERQIQELNEIQQSYKAQIRDLDAAVCQRDGKLEALERDLSEKQSSLDALEQRLANQNAEIAALQEELVQERDERQVLQRTLDEERDERQVLQRTLDEERDERQVLQRTLDEERDAQQKLQRILDQERDQRQALQRTLDQERDQRQALQRTLDQERDQRQALQRTLDQERDQRQALQWTLDQERNQSQALQQSLQQKDQALQHIQQRSQRHLHMHQAVLNSKSWKLTAPLRVVEPAMRTMAAMPILCLSRGPRTFWREYRQYRLIKTSRLFDEAYYLERNPDVRQAGLDPIWHYIWNGAEDGRDPNPLFVTRWYVQHYPDVTESGMNPLLHYLLHGAEEGRNPGPGFVTSWYLEHNPDVAEGDLHPLVHYLYRGMQEGRLPAPTAAGYAGQYLPAVTEVDLKPAMARGQESNSWFDFPWHGKVPPATSVAAAFHILVVSHDASRTGAPKCALHALQALAGRPGIQTWALLGGGGVLSEAFAAAAPTLDISKVVSQGQSRQFAFANVIKAFRDTPGVGRVAICNTAVISAVNRMCAEHSVPVISWIHELPTSIEMFLGGRETFNRVYQTSRKIITVSDYALDALAEYAGCADRSKFTRIYAGNTPRTSRYDRDSAREKVCKEFALPQEAVIVLGCGTADHRKGADLFTQVAMHTLGDQHFDTAYFIWIGKIYDKKIIQWCRHDTQQAGIAKHVIFADERKDPELYYQAADIFALTSREDPFPLVNLEAMAFGLPVVSFLGGGGACEIHNDERGVTVPYLDTLAMSRAVVDLARNPQQRQAIGVKAAQAVHDYFHWGRFADDLLNLLQREFDYRPRTMRKVSVIVPNYNCAPYIRQRLESILNQTVPPAEIIFLDDASTDDSVAIATGIAADSSVSFKFMRNDRNLGSPFRQWQRGLQEASNDIVWIAEADDYCEPIFLEKMVPLFDDPQLMIAFSQSAPVGSNGERFAPNYLAYTTDISKERWRQSYIAEGAEEIADALSLKNTIPNASAVMVRRQPGLEAVKEAISFRFAGDWMFYVAAASLGKIGFIADTLNYHRRHEKTVTHQAERDNLWIEETLEIKCRIFETGDLAFNKMAESLCRTIADYEERTLRLKLDRPSFSLNPKIEVLRKRLARIFSDKIGAKQDTPSLLFVIADGQVGGGETTAVRLANQLAKHHQVFLLNARPQLLDATIPNLISDEVLLLEGSVGLGAWYGLNDAPDPHQPDERSLRLKTLQQLIRFFSIDVIVSQIWWADRFAFSLNRELRLPWFIHMQGCYECLVDEPNIDFKFMPLVGEMMVSVKGIFYAHDKNLVFFDKLKLPRPQNTMQIGNGIPLEDIRSRPIHDIDRRENDFAFCLCARAIPEKGWEEAIRATLAINALPSEKRGQRRARLFLIGGGPYLQELRHRYNQHNEIEFSGLLAHPTDLIAACDVGLLPSRFTGESAPMSVIEYLACDLPVIASDIGSIASMIESNGIRAGIVFPVGNPDNMVDQLISSMLHYMTDCDALLESKQNAAIIFKRNFDIEVIANIYFDFMRDSLISTPRHLDYNQV